MKRIASLFAAALCAFVMSAQVFAIESVYLLNDLDPSEWRGAGIEKDEAHGVISTAAGSSGSGDTLYTFAEFPVGGSRAVLVYVDAGGYQGDKNGSVTVRFLDGNGGTVAESGKEIVCDGSFRRYSCGAEDLYAEIPDGAEKVRIILSAEGKAPYYRNFTLKLSDTAPRASGEMTWTSSDKLGLVDVRTTGSQHMILVLFVFLVALAIFGVRKILDSFRKDRIKTASGRGNV